MESPLPLLGVTAAPARRDWRGCGLLSVGLLAPADTATWVAVAFGLAALSDGRALGARTRGAVFLFAMMVGLYGWSVRWRGAAGDREWVAALVERFGDRHRLIAPWTMGVRISTELTGVPYGMLWRTPQAELRKQRGRWCEFEGAGDVLVVEHREGRWLWRLENEERAATWDGCEKL